jgi:lysophospholipase L1-like esterase
MKFITAMLFVTLTAISAFGQPPAKNSSTVVFIGDSITEFWSLSEYFSGQNFINKGINSQSTVHLLARMQNDVIALKPKVVVIHGGINDLYGDNSAAGIAKTEKNLEAMARMAADAGIKVVIASLMPVNNTKQDLTTGRPAAKILAVNAWIKKFAVEKKYVFLDYYPAFAGKDGLLKTDLSDDGIHPNAKGYALMKPLALAAIDKALKKK